MDQITQANNVPYRGIPDTQVTWTGSGDIGGPGIALRKAQIFTEIRKTPMVDKHPFNDNQGERLGWGRTNKRVQMTFSAKPIGTDASGAFSFAEDLPLPGDVTVAITSSDPQLTALAGTVEVESCDTSYTPEGEVVINFTVIKWADSKTFAIRS